jgi:quercetin dioxygenase-like cupin family protein
MTTMAATASGAEVVYRQAKAGDIFVGPRDLYRFLVTGAETGGAYFAMEALVAPGGGPPPHIHTREDETFYILDGSIEFRLGDETVTAGPGDYVSVPRGVVHNFRNPSNQVSRLILTFTPAGMEHFFLETLERAESMDVPIPDNLDEVAARYVEAAPRHGMEFV